MKLDDSQKATISQWVSEGLKLSDIQTKIQETFDVSLTYMDARFLIDDLELELKDQPKPVDNDLRNAPPPPPPPAPEEPVPEMEDSTTGTANVSVVLDRLYKPGAVVSGQVTFTDGEQADWALDQMGRLSLKAATEGYQPVESDIQEFQQQLSALLQNQGF